MQEEGEIDSGDPTYFILSHFMYFNSLEFTNHLPYEGWERTTKIISTICEREEEMENTILENHQSTINETEVEMVDDVSYNEMFGKKAMKEGIDWSFQPHMKISPFNHPHSKY